MSHLIIKYKMAISEVIYIPSTKIDSTDYIYIYNIIHMFIYMYVGGVDGRKGKGK